MTCVVCEQAGSETLHLRSEPSRGFALCGVSLISDVRANLGQENAGDVCERCLRIAQFFSMVQEVT